MISQYPHLIDLNDYPVSWWNKIIELGHDIKNHPQRYTHASHGNIKATLYDGSYHDVDSSEIAFKMAASLAFRKGMEEAQPVLLETIMSLKITITEEYMGDVMGDINKSRG